MTEPLRGEIWLADLNPTRGREQMGRRPVLIISEDIFNRGPADLVIVLPITSRLRGIPAHVIITPPEGGLKSQSAIMCEAVRSISKGRLLRHFGTISRAALESVEDRLTILLGL